eukprot:6052268-Prymnesium_polylepis.1
MYGSQSMILKSGSQQQHRSSGQPSEAVKSWPRHYFYRALVCALAVALLWSSSLSVSRYVAASFVTVPPVNEVFTMCKRTYAEVKRQKAAHMSCTARQMQQCDARLARQLEDETRRSRTDALANRGVVRRAVELKQRCTAQQLATLDAIEHLQQASVPLVWSADRGACSADELQRAQAVVGDIGVVRDRAMSVASKYAQDVQLLQSLALTGIEARMDYDTQYVAAKTEALRALPGQLRSISRRQAQAMRAALARLNGSLPHVGTLPLQPQLDQMRSQVGRT